MTPTTPALIPGVSPIASTRQCHDITVYPSLGLAGGACQGHGFLLDIKDPVNPIRIDAVSDSNFAFWHSATFNNDGTKILFTDEWGGGSAPRCRASDKKEWGSNAIFTIENRKMVFKSYYKLPAAQTSNENCVAHNGSLIPIPGRDVMIQGWYQGGISVFDWTDASNPIEIASFDRGPVDSTRLVSGGSWSAYWYNGAIFSSEIARGMDIAELVPSEHLTQNEIDAAKTVRWDVPQRAGPAEDRVAAKFFAGQGVRRPARTIEVPVVRQDCVGATVDRRRGTVDGPTTGERAEPTVDTDRQRCPVLQPVQDPAAAEGIDRPVDA